MRRRQLSQVSLADDGNADDENKLADNKKEEEEGNVEAEDVNSDHRSAEKEEKQKEVEVESEKSKDDDGDDADGTDDDEGDDNDGTSLPLRIDRRLTDARIKSLFAWVLRALSDDDDDNDDDSNGDGDGDGDSVDADSPPSSSPSSHLYYSNLVPGIMTIFAAADATDDEQTTHEKKKKKVSNKEDGNKNNMMNRLAPFVRLSRLAEDHLAARFAGIRKKMREKRRRVREKKNEQDQQDQTTETEREKERKAKEGRDEKEKKRQRPMMMTMSSQSMTPTNSDVVTLKGEDEDQVGDVGANDVCDDDVGDHDDDDITLLPTGAIIDRATREHSTLSSMGLGWSSRPHAVLDVSKMSSVDEWVRSLPRGCRRTLQKANENFVGTETHLRASRNRSSSSSRGNGASNNNNRPTENQFFLVTRTIRSDEPAPQSSLSHFRCVVEHEMRVEMDEEGFFGAIQSALWRWQVTNRQTGTIFEYRDALTGRVIAFAHEVRKGRTIRGQWFYGGEVASKSYVWFHSVQELVRRAIATPGVDTADLGPSGTDAFSELKTRYGFHCTSNWRAIADYSGGFYYDHDHEEEKKGEKKKETVEESEERDDEGNEKNEQTASPTSPGCLSHRSIHQVPRMCR